MKMSCHRSVIWNLYNLWSVGVLASLQIVMLWPCWSRKAMWRMASAGWNRWNFDSAHSSACSMPGCPSAVQNINFKIFCAVQKMLEALVTKMELYSSKDSNYHDVCLHAALLRHKAPSFKACHGLASCMKNHIKIETTMISMFPAKQF